MLDAIAGIGLLTAVAPTEPAMTARSGLGLLLIGGAAALRNREDAGPISKALSLLAALVVLVFGIATLAEHALAVDLRIDRLFLPGTEPELGRPPPPAALALSFLAGALLLLDVRASARVRPSEWLALAAGFTALTALLGFIFGAELHHRVTRVPLIGAALPTAVALLLISVGLLLQRPTAGLMRVATSRGPGGQQFRRFVLPTILIPIVVGLVVTFPLRAVGSEALAVVVAVLAAAMTMVGLFVLGGTAISLNRTYEALEASRAGTRAMVEQAPDGWFIADLTGRYTDVNSAGCRMLGYSREEVLARSIADVILPEELDRLAQVREAMLGGETLVMEWTLRRKDGSLMSAEISGKVFPDGRWQGLVRDISERKRLEEELRVAEAEPEVPRRARDRRSCRRSTIARPRRSSRGGSSPSSPTAARSKPWKRTDNCTTGWSSIETRARRAACRIARKAKIDTSRPYVGARGPRDEAADADPRRHAGIPRIDRAERRAPSRRCASWIRSRSWRCRCWRTAGWSARWSSSARRRAVAYTAAGSSLRRGRGDARRPGGGEGPPLPDRPARDPAARRRAQHRRPRSAQPAGHHPDAGRRCCDARVGSRSAGRGSRAR